MRLLKFPTLFAIVLTTLLFTACKDDPSEFGADVIPDSDKFKGLSIDTVTVKAIQYNYIEKLSNTDYSFVGIATDPYFGRISATLFNDIVLEKYPTKYDGLVKTVDSVHLYLFFDQTMFHNSSNNLLRLQVYSMTDSLSTSALYDTSFKKEKYINPASLLTSETIDIQDKYLKLVMPSNTLSYFQKIVDLDSAQLNNKTEMHKIGVYGFAFVPVDVAGNGIIARLNTADYTKTYLNVYYHIAKKSTVTQNDTTINDYLNFSFISSWDTSYYTTSKSYYGNPKANLVTYDYSKTSVSNGLNGLSNDSLFYVLGEAGQKAKLDFSNLSYLPDQKKYNVIKAELFIPFQAEYYKPDNNVHTLLPLGSYRLFYEERPDTFSIYYDKQYKHLFNYEQFTPTIDTATNSIKFDVTEYIQKRLNGTTSINEFCLLQVSSGFSSAILKKNKIKLKIKYTKL
jgi:hypothetical protein